MAAEGAPSPDELRAIVADALRAHNVVGASVSIVREDKVLLCEGFGEREKGSGVGVDADTLFAIGSATKAFTTLSAALCAEEGRLDWDAPVRGYLPEFALADPVASAEASPRDLACHRVGLPRHEAVWYKSGLTRKEIIERLRHLESNRPFRTTFQYQNMMITTLGYLVGRLSGGTWEAFVAERILAPLGMARTNFSVHRSKEDANHALPYGLGDGTNEALPFADIDAIGPAGSINSCARDMAQWLRLQLGTGEVDGRRIVSRASLEMMHSPHTVMRATVPDERRRAPAYGLGWFTEVYEGKSLVHHGGNIDGFTAMVMLVPDAGLGVAVLSNQNLSVLPAAIAYSVVDRYLSLPGRDWSAYLEGEKEKMLAAARQGGDFSPERVPGTSPGHPLDAYVGAYEHPAYGTIRIGRSAEGLSLAYHFWPEPRPLEHFHYDVFVLNAEMQGIPMALRVPFRTALDGSIEALEIQIESLLAPIAFRRGSESVTLSADDLARYEGTYLVAGVQRVRVERVGEGALSASVEGQPAMELVPRGGHRFGLKGLDGYSVQFEFADDGTCTGGRFTQPGGVYPLARADGA